MQIIHWDETVFKSKILPVGVRKLSLGISTSCLYPQNTEEALEELGRIGVKTCEIFLNSPSELTKEFAATLNIIKDYYGMDIVSIHPFSSFAETYMLFSEYSRRFNDMLDMYKKTFELAALVGARFSIIHGSLLPGKISDEEYAERFMKLCQAGSECGVAVCQENVNRHFSQSPDFLKKMRNILKDDFRLVFDIKQAVRAGYSPIDFAEEFKENIVHIHVSDHLPDADCLPPGCGNFDFEKLFAVMDSVNYGGDYIIELYRHNFNDSSDLKKAFDYLSGMQKL